MSILVDCTIVTIMETQGRSDSTVKFPLCHEMRDLVDEILHVPWDVRDTSSSSSGSLSPRAPLADISSELQHFNILEKDDLFQTASKCVKTDGNIKKIVELETEKYKDAFRNNSEKVIIGYGPGIEENRPKWNVHNENTEKIVVNTELKAQEYMWSVTNNESGTDEGICRFEREKCESKLDNNHKKIVMISEAGEEECQEPSKLRALDHSTAVLGVGREDWEGRMQGDNKEMDVTFSETDKREYERTTVSGNMENIELVSGVVTGGSVRCVTEEGAEDNAEDTEYPASVSRTGSPHRRTIAAGDRGAVPQCVGTLGFFHMQPETEQVVWGSRRASDRDPSISAPEIYHRADISAAHSCGNVEQAIISSVINAVRKYIYTENIYRNISPVSLNNANVKQYRVPPDMIDVEIKTNVEDENEQIVAVVTGISSIVDQLYTNPTLNVASPEESTSNEYYVISDENELISAINGNSTITVGLNVASEQPTVSVGDVRVDIHIVVGDRMISPITEPPNNEGISDEAFSGADCINVSVKDAVDVTEDLSKTENVHFGDEIVSVSDDILIRIRSAAKYVQTDSVSNSDNESVSDESCALKKIPFVSIDKCVQTDYLSLSPCEQKVGVYKTDTSVSLCDVNIIGTHIVDKDCNQTDVRSVLPFSGTNDLVEVLEHAQSFSVNDYSDEREEITGISNNSEPSSTSSSARNQFPRVVSSLVSADEATVTQTDGVSVSAENLYGTEHLSGLRMNYADSINVESDGCRTASAGEEVQELTEGLSCTLQVLTYRDRLFPPLCSSCLLPQSVARVRQGGTRVHNSAQIKSDSAGDHVTFLGHGEDNLLNVCDNVLEPKYSVDRGLDKLPIYQYRDIVQTPVKYYHRQLRNDTESGSCSLTAAQSSTVPEDITSLLCQPLYGDYNVRNGSGATWYTDVSSRRPLDLTSSNDNLGVPHRCRQGEEMGSHYSTQESEESETDRCHTDSVGGEEETTNTDGENAVLEVTKEGAVTIITNITDADLKDVSLSTKSDCATINTDLGLINMGMSNTGMRLNNYDSSMTTEAMNTYLTDVALNTATINNDLKCYRLNSTDEAANGIDETNTGQRNVPSATCDTNETSDVENKNVELSSTASGAATSKPIVPTTIEQLIGATRSYNRRNISFPFIDENEDNAANEDTAVAMTTRDNIRLDIDRCVASFQRDHMLDTLSASGGRGIRYESAPEENDLSKSKDMGHIGAVTVPHSDKETQTAVDLSAIITSKEAMRNAVDKETQTKAVNKDIDVTEATPTKQTECTEAHGASEKATTEMATETKQRIEEEGTKLDMCVRHPCAAPRSTASPVSTADERRTSSGDIGSEAAHDGTICAAADSSEQYAPESGRAEESRNAVPRDQAPVHRASDAAVPRDTVSAVGNRCCDAMRQKNKTNDNDAAPADKPVIIANGGTSTEAASGAANDCNGHVNNHHHHSTARSILKSVLKRTGNGGHHKKTPGSKAAPVPVPPPPPLQQPPPPQNQPAPKKKHRVQFDESKNKFFDADYVILIREEDDEEEEEEDEEGEEEEMEDEEEVCTCGASAEVGRLLPPIVGMVKTPPPAGCGRPIQPPGGAVQVLLRTPGTCSHV